ncbi:hypothetical protein [Hymenobacter pini]|uniref:hypothetical protein n=1 Tax=Hymenobacter pini TaxID=2880879 RepID=UPI001CF22601|nr:hypothetical protein [Hymenobacter pini]MCA8831958.1 hypothetical protein [Hymenobacter pini]
MSPEISAWLASEQDYATGVALYEQHGTSGVYKRLLAGACTNYNRGLLARELGKLVETVPAAEPEPAPTPVVAPPVDVMTQLRQARRPLLSEREFLHARLELVGDAERHDSALRILDIGDELQKSYDAEAHYVQYGTLPEPPPVAEPAPELATLTSKAEIQYHLKLLRTQRSKLHGREDRATDYAQVLANIELLESKLSSDAE